MTLVELLEGLSISEKCGLRFEHKEVLSYSHHTPAMIAKLSKLPLNRVKVLLGVDFNDWDDLLHPESYCRWVDEEFGRSFGDSAREWEKRRISRKNKISVESTSKNA